MEFFPRVLPALLAGTLAACAPALPTYPWRGPGPALEILAERADRVETLAAQGALTLTRRGGAGVTLDCAIVAQRPDRFRLRAWKSGQAVLDLTVRPDGTFFWAAERIRGEAGGLRPGALPARLLAAAGFAAGGTFFRDGRTAVVDGGGGTFIARGPMAGPAGVALEAEIDRATLTVREFRIVGAEGRGTERILLDRYRIIGERPWPTRIRAEGEPGTAAIRIREMEVNAGLAPSAFDPPPRAEKQEW